MFHDSSLSLRLSTPFPLSSSLPSFCHLNLTACVAMRSGLVCFVCLSRSDRQIMVWSQMGHVTEHVSLQEAKKGTQESRNDRRKTNNVRCESRSSYVDTDFGFVLCCVPQLWFVCKAAWGIFFSVQPTTDEQEQIDAEKKEKEGAPAPSLFVCCFWHSSTAAA